MQKLSFPKASAIFAAFFSLAFRAILSPAQTTAPAKPATSSCPVHDTPMSAGDIALAHNKYAEAIELYRTESKAAGPDGERAHAAMIRAMLRDQQIPAADKDARSWAAAAPTSVWARVGLEEVEWREGHMTEAVNLMVEASRMDRCNAQIHADFARVMAFAGNYATAKAQMGSAHDLAPLDDSIEEQWIFLQPRLVQLEELTHYLERSTFLSDVERKSIEKTKEALSRPRTDTCKLTTPLASTTIPFHGIQNGAYASTTWGLEVAFNGKVRRLVIDTGAHGLFLTHGAATALHLQPERTATTEGLGDEGSVDSFYAKVETIKIGGLEFKDCDVEVEMKDNSATWAGSADGLIGGDVFSDFLLTLDFPGRMVKLDPLPPLPGTSAQPQEESLATGVQADDRPLHDRYIDPSMKDWTRIYRVGHELILPIRLNDGPTKFFLVDTGSSLNLISPDAAHEVAKVSKGSAYDIYGVSGKVNKTYTTGPLNLDFAGMRYPTTGLTAVDTGSVGRETGVEIGGFLGAPTLHQLTLQIDYRDNLMHFAFDPKRITRCVEGVNVADCY